MLQGVPESMGLSGFSQLAVELLQDSDFRAYALGIITIGYPKP